MNQKMKKYSYLCLQLMYYLFPKFFRNFLKNQYSESFKFYKEFLYIVIEKLLKKSTKCLSGNTLFFSFTNSIEELHTNNKILFELKNRTSTMQSPMIYGKSDHGKWSKTLTENVLDIGIYFFENISILGHTDALLYEGLVYHQELLCMKPYHDLKRWDIFSHYNREQKNLFLNVSQTIYLNNEKNLYVSLLKEHSINYYHWITENMPRLILIIRELNKSDNSVVLENKHVVILVDEGVPKQCIEMMSFLIPFKYTIQTIKKGQFVECRNLVYCTPLWHSLDNTKNTLALSDFFVDKFSLEQVYKAIKSNPKLDILKNPFRKIYLRRRPSQMRSIINNNQVEKFMVDQGFEIIETDKMPFWEQVELFHEASIVVGASGATFTNILFMQPKTKVIIFYPNHPSMNYTVFQGLADVSNVKLMHFQALAIDTHSVHSNFFVELGRIKEILRNEI